MPCTIHIWEGASFRSGQKKASEGPRALSSRRICAKTRCRSMNPQTFENRRHVLVNLLPAVVQCSRLSEEYVQKQKPSQSGEALLIMGSIRRSKTKRRTRHAPPPLLPEKMLIAISRPTEILIKSRQTSRPRNTFLNTMQRRRQKISPG
jgi:hypothetical protein